jgi:hypothetical protein
MLNDTLDFDSLDEKRLTGTETRPNEIVAEAIERAGIGGSDRGEAARALEKSYFRWGHLSTRLYSTNTFVMYGDTTARDADASRSTSPAVRDTVGLFRRA